MLVESNQLYDVNTGLETNVYFPYDLDNSCLPCTVKKSGIC